MTAVSAKLNREGSLPEAVPTYSAIDGDQKTEPKSVGRLRLIVFSYVGFEQTAHQAFGRPNCPAVPSYLTAVCAD